MSAAESTCWTVIRAAAAGSPADREELARRVRNAGYRFVTLDLAGFRGSSLPGLAVLTERAPPEGQCAAGPW